LFSLFTVKIPSVSGTSVRSIFASYYWLAFWSSHIGCFQPFLSFNHIKLYCFIIPNTAQVFPWIIALDGSLMDKDIFFGVIPVYESISIPDIEPLYGARDFGCNNLWWGFFIRRIVC